jgi:hypothetical protein
MTIYLIACDGYTKIGHTDGSPNERLRQLQTGSPHTMHLLGITPGGIHDERALHAEFADRHIRGEWFELTIEQVRTVLTRHIPRALPVWHRPTPGAPAILTETWDNGDVTVEEMPPEVADSGVTNWPDL